MAAPGRLSRYRFCSAVTDEDGTVFLTDPEPFGYEDLPDNQRHKVVEGDNLWALASRYFDVHGIDNPAELWWVIAEFQPDPVFDPTIKLEIGRVMHIPSVRTVLEDIFSESRRAEHL
jgi:hypothetical protein